MDNIDNLRFILLFALAFVGLLLYQAWIHDYGDNASQVQSPVITTPGTSVQPSAVPISPTVPTAVVSSVPQENTPLRAPFVTVETDVLRAEISTRGGTLEDLYLLDYPITPENPEAKFQLFRAQDPNFYIAQSGLIGSKKDVAPSHDSMFTTSATSYHLDSGQDAVSVDLTWSNASGVKVTKRFTFKRGSYLVNLIQTVENRSSSPWPVRAYVQLQRSKLTESKDSFSSRTYTGAAYYTSQEKYKKLTFDEIARTPHQSEAADGWVAMIQHYFVSAWIPEQAGTKTIYTSTLPGPRYTIGMYSPTITVQPGETHTFTDQLVAGPQLQKQLAAITPGLELTVDYGWLTIFAQPIFWLLDKLHSIFQNWGWAIIFLTIIIKGAFYKLSETSYKSMAGMRKLAPKLQEIKERYGDDKERLNQAMMDIYKKEKINPLGGCLPIVVQIPVFIALYWVLLESVEMRQAPFVLWITNLSAPDPYFVLPLVMGISMFIQQQLNPAPVDPMQAKAMMAMPFMFTVFFAFFPSGLVLYWVVNNLISIAQQWYIVRLVEGADAKRAAT